MIVDAKEVCARHFSFAQKDVPALQGDAKFIATEASPLPGTFGDALAVHGCSSLLTANQQQGEQAANQQ